jgi:DNA-binding NarL/FixJ family response regulator
VRVLPLVTPVTGPQNAVMVNPYTSDAVPNRGALTPRQREILALVASGLSTPDVAKQLNIAPGTVKTHLTAIYKAIGVHNRVQAARYYLDHLALRSRA